MTQPADELVLEESLQAACADNEKCQNGYGGKLKSSDYGHQRVDSSPVRFHKPDDKEERCQMIGSDQDRAGIHFKPRLLKDHESVEGDAADKSRPHIEPETADHHPEHPLTPECREIGLFKFRFQLPWLANAASRQPERFLVAQSRALEALDRVAQMVVQLQPDFTGEAGSRGQLHTPVREGGVQIETGLMFHNLLKVLWTVSHCWRSAWSCLRPSVLSE